MPTALITGATEGIGRATAFALGRAGYKLGVCARTPSKLRTLLEELTKAGFEAAGHPCDVASAADVAAMVAEVTGRLGPIDVLVNNAGIAILKPFAELTLDDWDQTMATNLRGIFLCTQAVLAGMRERKQGAIINIASLAGRSGFVGGTAYVASKHAVLGFSRALMLEVRKEKIRVITILPGSVDTPLIRNQGTLKPNVEKILHADDVAQVVVDALRLPERALISELDLRPTDP